MAAGPDPDDLDLVLRESDQSGHPWFSRFRPPRVLTLVAAGADRAVVHAREIAADPPWPGGELRIWEADRGSAELAARSCGDALGDSGWTVHADADLQRALWGADVVIHAVDHVGPADPQDVPSPLDAVDVGAAREVLRLSAALRTVSGQRRYASAFAQHARGVPILTTSEPLPISTAQLASARLPVMGVGAAEVMPTLRAIGGTAVVVPVWVVDPRDHPAAADARQARRLLVRLVDTHREVLGEAPDPETPPADPDRDGLVLTAALDPARRHVTAALIASAEVAPQTAAALADRVLGDFEDWLLRSPLP